MEQLLPNQSLESMEKTSNFRTKILLVVLVACAIAILVCVLLVAGFWILKPAPVEVGYVSVRNNGDYLTKFTLEYKLNGTNIVNSSDLFRKDFAKIIKIPKGARDVLLKVSEQQGESDSFSEFFATTFPGPFIVCYSVSGNWDSPTCAKVDC